MRTALILILGIILSSCASRQNIEPRIAIAGKSYARPHQSSHTSFYATAATSAGNVIDTLESQNHLRLAREAIRNLGYTEQPILSADIGVFVSFETDSKSESYQRTVPTVGVAGGQTSTINAVHQTPSGMITTTGTVTSPTQIVPTGSYAITTSTTYQRGRIIFTAFDAKAKRLDPSLSPIPEIWTCEIRYAYESDTMIPRETFYPALLKHVGKKLISNEGDWAESVQLRSLFDN